jgi:hypothetical protein
MKFAKIVVFLGVVYFVSFGTTWAALQINRKKYLPDDAKVFHRNQHQVIYAL